jgi:hypothetical protein
MSPEQLEKMQNFRDTMTQLRTSAEASLGKILDKKQVARLKQIQFQLDPAGPWIVLREDMVEKLNMTEEQVAQLTEMRNGQRQVERDMRKTNRETMDAVMKKANPDFQGFNFGNRGNNRGNRGNGGNNAGNNQGNNGGNDAGNNQANNGGRQNGNQGGNRQFDPEAFQKMRDEMQKMNEMPEVKAERDKQRDMEKSLENDSYAMIMKALYPRQRTTLKNMAGAPFDRSVMGGGGPFGRFGGGGPGAVTKNGAAGTAKTAAVAKKNSEDDEEDGTPAEAATAKPAAPAKPAASTNRRKSLRELRGDDE